MPVIINGYKSFMQMKNRYKFVFLHPMSRRIPQEKKFLKDIAIIDIAEEGRGVGKTEDLVLFVEKAVPGDVVDVELCARKRILRKLG